MLIIPVKEGESIDKALKKFKKKFERTGTMRELRRRHAPVPACEGEEFEESGAVGHAKGRNQNDEGRRLLIRVWDDFCHPLSCYAALASTPRFILCSKRPAAGS